MPTPTAATEQVGNIMQLVWFKRDLRIYDHKPLYEAAKSGPLIPLYILEPELWAEPDMSHRQYMFLCECIKSLDTQLEQLGQKLIIRIGDAVDILQTLHDEHNITSLWSHQETWNGWTYKRDLKVKQWTKANHINWYEPPQFAVTRRLQSRNGWAENWAHMMRDRPIAPPEKLPPVLTQTQILPKPEALNLTYDHCNKRQSGGRKHAERCLQTFLSTRGQNYSRAMSSPLTAETECSRLSPHIAFGTLSLREIYHAYQERSADIAATPSFARNKWPQSLRAFASRLHWHCHFIQKLEDEPRLEFENLHPAYDGLRENDFNEAHFEAWKAGKTGYPMVDASMRTLIYTGWINFRMRSMLMSFASYHLWLHWRETALHLAKLFTDYEPGIHYSQVQMQSGTTGINTTRIYNPIKQGLDHDPNGHFVRRWIPELSDMPQEHLHTPWKAPNKMGDYPMPIVDEKEARKDAAAKIYRIRKSGDHRQKAKQIVDKHASRKTDSARSKPKRRSKPQNPNQIELPL